MEVTPYNVEYYFVSQSVSELMDEHLGGVETITDNLSALDSRLEQMYTNKTPKAQRLDFLHYVLMLWGGQIFPRELTVAHWRSAAEKYRNFDYGGEE